LIDQRCQIDYLDAKGHLSAAAGECVDILTRNSELAHKLSAFSLLMRV